MAQPRTYVDTDDDRIDDGEPSYYFILKIRKRQEARMVYRVYDNHGNPQMASGAILRTFIEFMRRKYNIQEDEENIERKANNLHKALPHAANNVLDPIITMVELIRGKEREISQSSWQCWNSKYSLVTWETTKHILAILNKMHMKVTILDPQKHGIIVCLHKAPRYIRPEDFRLLTCSCWNNKNRIVNFIARFQGNLRHYPLIPVHDAQEQGTWREFSKCQEHVRKRNILRTD